MTQLTSELAQYRDDFVYQNVISKVLNVLLIRLYDTIDQTLAIRSLSSEFPRTISWRGCGTCVSSS